MSDYEFTMSLGIRHPDIDPGHVSQALGLQPGHAWRNGEERVDATGAALGGNHRESYWLCEFPPRARFSSEGNRLESELSQVLHTLRRSVRFMQDLQHGGGIAELFVSIYARGDFRIELLADEAALLGRMGVALTVEVKPYPVTTAALAGTQ